MRDIAIFPVTSSAISGIGHDGADTLRVRFTSGLMYDYKGVSVEAFTRLRKSESVGAHFNAQVRDRYPTRKVTQ